MLGLAATVSGCAAVSGLVANLSHSDSLPALQKFSLRADRLSNNGAPVAVDLVLVFDKKPLAMLGALRAGEWFSNREDYLRQYQNQLRVASWEIVPGQIIKPMSVSEDQSKLVGVFIFADYLGAQSFRADASNMSSVRVQLSKDDYSISPF